MKISEIEAKLNLKQRQLDKENESIENSRKRISGLKNEIAELEKQLLNKKTDELFLYMKHRSLSIDDVIDMVNTSADSDMLQETEEEQGDKATITYVIED